MEQVQCYQGLYQGLSEEGRVGLSLDIKHDFVLQMK